MTIKKEIKTKTLYIEEIDNQNEIINNYSSNFNHLIEKYFNFEYFGKENVELVSTLYDICKYDYPSFFETLIQAKKDNFNINSKIIFTKKSKTHCDKKDFYYIYNNVYNYDYKEEYSTLLFTATRNEKLNIIKILLNEPEINVNACLREYFWTHESKINANENNIKWWKNDLNDSISDGSNNCFYEHFKLKTLLNISLKNQNFEIIEFLFSHSIININTKSISRKWILTYNEKHNKVENTYEKDETLLITSIKKDDINIMKLLLSNPSILINKKSNYKKGIITSESSCPEKIFIKETESTPLSFSIENNKLEFVKLLLSQSLIELNLKIIEKFISFEVDQSFSKKKFKMHNWILDNEMQKHSVFTKNCLSGQFEVMKEAFHIAIYKGNAQIIHLLLSKPEFDVNTNMILKNNHDKKEETALHIAAQNGNFELFKFLFSKIKININSKSMDLINCRNPEEKSLLHIAVENNHLEIVKFLLSVQDIDINQLSSDKNTALHFAVGKKKYSENDIEKYSDDELNNRALEILKLLVSYPSININAKKIDKISDKEYSEKTALYIAAKHKKIEQLEILLSHPEIDVNAPFLRINDNEIIKRKTVLYKVVKNENFEMIRDLLLHLDININEKYFYRNGDNEKEITPLHVAVLTANHAILRLLLSHPKINVNSRYFLKKDDYNFHLFKYFDFIDLNFTFWSGVKESGTALHIAFHQMNYEIIQILLSNRNININETMYRITEEEEIYGLAALHLAILKINDKIFRLLISNSKINPNIKFDIIKIKKKRITRVS